MADFVFVLAIAGFFALAALGVVACDRLVRNGHNEPGGEDDR